MEKKKYYHYILVSYDDLEYDDNYWYRTDNKEIDIGDKVLVDRVGTSVIATVEDSGFYLEDEVPYPINKTKEVIRFVSKCNEGDIDNDSEGKVDFEEEYLDDIDIQEIIEENQKLEYDNKIYRKIIEMATVSHLSIDRLIKAIINKNNYSELRYNKRLNLFISKIDSNLYFLPEYHYSIFSKSLGNKLFNGAKEIKFFEELDVEGLHKFALEFCKNNDINYIDNFKIEERKVGKNNVFKELEKEKMEEPITSLKVETYFGLKMYVRDMDLTNEIVDLYKNNIGKTVYEKAYVDCTYKISGLNKNTRFIIVSNSIKNISMFENNTDWGICVAERDSSFKILDVTTIENKNLIILLHLKKDMARIFKDKFEDLDKEIIKKCEEDFKEDIKREHIESLDKDWYKRLFFPIGISDNGEMQLR